MRFKIIITNEDLEVLNIIEIDPEDQNWNTGTTARFLGNDIINEIERAIARENDYEVTRDMILNKIKGDI